MRPFRLIEWDSSPGCRRIQVEGEVDLAVAERLGQALRRARWSRRLAIDLERCDFVDLAALALLARAGHTGQAEDRQVTIHGARGQPLRLFAATGLVGGLVPQGSRQTATRCPPAFRPA